MPKVLSKGCVLSATVCVWPPDAIFRIITDRRDHSNIRGTVPGHADTRAEGYGHDFLVRQACNNRGQRCASC